MKKQEIFEGMFYTNGKGRIRKVLASDNHDAYFDLIKYEVVADGTKENRSKGYITSITKGAFSRWAIQTISQNDIDKILSFFNHE